jgi:glycine/D-amino acid oxidase-like deaminating enzyme
VFHVAPRDAATRAAFADGALPVFNVDITKTGWYGFPAAGARDAVVKLANHGVGRAFDPASDAREANADEMALFRDFTARTFPALAREPLATTRICVYGDTSDLHFWIAPDPERPGLVVAAGGSGHAFKFAPVIGELIADATVGTVVPRFRWRPEIVGARGEEAARRK